MVDYIDMTKDGWGSEWPKVEINVPIINLDRVKDIAVIAERQKQQRFIPVVDKVFNEGPWPDDPFAWPKSPELTGLNLGTGERTTLTKFNDNGDVIHTIISQTQLKSQGSNLVDDQAYLYFQCESCNEIFDPHTKSFAKLQEARAKAEWIVKWNLNGQGYKVYCQKCGEKV